MRAVLQPAARILSDPVARGLPSGIEVDFVVSDMQVAIKAKATPNATADHHRALRELARDHAGVGQRVLVCREPRPHDRAA